jgi:hypothetical protein
MRCQKIREGMNKMVKIEIRRSQGEDTDKFAAFISVDDESVGLVRFEYLKKTKYDLSFWRGDYIVFNTVSNYEFVWDLI